MHFSRKVSCWIIFLCFDGRVKLVLVMAAGLFFVFRLVSCAQVLALRRMPWLLVRQGPEGSLAQACYLVSQHCPLGSEIGVCRHVGNGQDGSSRKDFSSISHNSFSDEILCEMFPFPNVWLAHFITAHVDVVRVAGLSEMVILILEVLLRPDWL